MYFICVIRKKGSKSFFLLHLLTNTGERIALFQNDIYETVPTKKTNPLEAELKKAFLPLGLCKKYKY